MKKIFITGIGTDIGKTIASAVVVEALQADYWKPIQSGGLAYTDSRRVRDLVSNPKSVFHPEAYTLQQPLSPYAAAAIDGITIDLQSLQLPQTNNTLVIEGAGGLMVPLNDKHLILDLIKQSEASCILVSKNYLGSINHTLLTHAVMQAHHIPVLGILFNGLENPASESFIAQYSNAPILGRIEQTDVLDKSFVKRHAELLRKRMQQLKLI